MVILESIPPDTIPVPFGLLFNIYYKDLLIL